MKEGTSPQMLLVRVSGAVQVQSRQLLVHRDSTSAAKPEVNDSEA